MESIYRMASYFTDSWWKKMLFFSFLFSIFLSIYIIFILPINQTPLLYASYMVFNALFSLVIIEKLRKGSLTLLLGLYMDRYIMKNFIYLLVISTSGFLLYILILFLYQSKVSFFEHFELNAILILTLQILLLAFFEEIVFRAFIFQTLINRFGEIFSAVVSSMIFVIFHTLNPSFDILSIINIFLFSIAISIIYLKTRSLILVTTYHFQWNIFQVLILGWPVSGYQFYYSIMDFDYETIPEYISGGKFGMESSVVVTLIILLSIYFFYKHIKQSPDFSSLLFKRDYYQEIKS